MKIKPLKWQPYIPFTNVTVQHDNTIEILQGGITATVLSPDNTVFSFYVIMINPNDSSNVFLIMCGSQRPPIRFTSIDDAKLYAEEHYLSTIKSLIDEA